MPAQTVLPLFSPTSFLEIPPTCQDTNSRTCAVVYHATGNSELADLAGWVIGKPFAILGLIVVGIVARWLLHRLVDRVVKGTENGVRPSKLGAAGLGRVAADPSTTARRAQRVQTMGSLLKSIVSGVVFVLTTVMVISELGYDVAPIIAGAGILGVAIGFGSQTLVKDFLSGIFMIFEDQYGVGDEVDLGEAVGVVEAISLRVTRLRDVNGTVWYVRNGEILRVGNMSQNWARTVLDIGVGYDENVERVKAVMAEVAHEVYEDEEIGSQVLEEPSVWGVQSLAADSVVVRLVMKTKPGRQWAVAREMRERIKARFDEEKIEMPLPQRVVWHRGEPGDPGEPTDSRRSAGTMTP